MVFRSRGLRRPRIAPEMQERVPPGQYLTERWPIMHAGPVPTFDPATWDFRVYGVVARPLRFSWPEFQQLPRVSIQGDLHCVTRWSKLDNTWHGVALRDLARQAEVRPEARFVILRCDGDYTANLPFDPEADEDVILALQHDGEDLSPAHGYPVRAIVPKRYAWKSAKWVRGIEFVATDQPGFWEGYGYHANGDPWREERFSE